MIKFSIVLAVYNKEQHLKETLESVMAQSYAHFEVIIINDGSTDGSERIIKEFLEDPRVSDYRQENQGAGAARNAGIAKASNPFIALLDSDDLWEPDYLATQAQLIKRFPEEAIFATAQWLQEGGKKQLKNYAISLDEGQSGIFNFFEASTRYALIHSSSVVIKKEALDKVGAFNPKIKSGQDTDLWIRLGAQYPVAFINKACSVYRLLPGTLFKSTTSVSQKLDTEAYSEIENTSAVAKKFIDLNRYSHAIQAKLWGESVEAKRLINAIDKSNLNSKQRFLLLLPKTLLQLLVTINNFLKKLGLGLSAFG